MFFFCDEALQANAAAQLLQNHFRDPTGTLLPPYFLNETRWAVSLSVYANLIPVWLFGKSIAAVRATTAGVTFFGVATGALALKEMRNRFWWSAPLVAGATALFFVHARLGFEAGMMASFYFAFLWAYFLYRSRGPGWVFATLLFGAATFYAYTAGQGVMLVTGLALLASDVRYHLRQVRARPALFAAALALALLLASPYVRYRRLHPGVVRSQLVALDSYWTHPIPLPRKLEQFARTYATAFDPRYWFRPNRDEEERHRMGDTPFLPLVFAPCIAAGVFACIRNFRKSSLHRAVLLSLLGVPFSAAAANLQILRLMGMVVPATLLTIVGVDWLYGGLARLRVPWAPVAAAVALALGLENGRLTRDALEKAPAWTRDFGFFGIEWGASQVFGAIREELRRSPDSEIMLSSTWANRPQEFIPFFLRPEEAARVRLHDILAWDLHPRPLSGHEVFVMTPEEWDLAIHDGKFVVGIPRRTIFYPNGHPGFRFVTLRYSADAPAIFEAERLARAALEKEEALVRGERWKIEHSRTDIGTVDDLFDDRLDTMLRGLEANPMFLDIRFPRARALREIGLSVGAMDRVHMTVRAYLASGEEKIVDVTASNRPARDWFFLRLPGGPVPAVRIRIEIAQGDESSPANIEIREVKFR